MTRQVRLTVDQYDEWQAKIMAQKKVRAAWKDTHEKGTVVGMETSAPERPVSRKAGIALDHAAGIKSGPSPILPRELVIVGQIQSGKNRILITRTGHRYPPERFKVWRDEVSGNLAKQWKDVPVTEPVRLHCLYWPGDRRTRDVSGMEDAMFHVLVKAGVLKDDGLVWDCLWYRQPLNRKGPKVLITVQEWIG